MRSSNKTIIMKDKILFLVLLLFSCASLTFAQAHDETPTAVTVQNRTGDLPFSQTVGTGVEHVDIGSGRPEVDGPAYRLLARYLPALMAANGVVVSDAPIASAQLLPLELPPQVAAERYFMYRAHP